MSNNVIGSPLLGPMLLLIFRHRITASNSDTGLVHLAASTDREASVDEWRAAVADARGAGRGIHSRPRPSARWHTAMRLAFGINTRGRGLGAEFAVHDGR
jgi:hypothetical protein